MNTPRVPPRFVPTLTEVVEFDEAQVLDEAAPAPADPVLQTGYVPLDRLSAESLDPHQPAADVGVDLAIDVERMADAVSALAGEVEAPPARVAPAAAVSDDVPAFLLAAQPVPAWTRVHEVTPAAVSVPPPVTESEAVAPAAALPMPAPPGDALSSEREEQIVQNVLTELQRRTDLMFEYRLREALAPLLARLTDALIKDARHDLAATLRDVVARAVAQELTRHRPK